MEKVGLKSSIAILILIPLLLSILPTEGYPADINADIIIDNGNAGTSSAGSWSVSGASGSYGSNSLWGRDGATYTWTFTPQQSGTYNVSMWWTVWPSRSSNIPVEGYIESGGGTQRGRINHQQNDGGTQRGYINQQQNGGKWNLLGTFNLTAGVTYKVTITAQPGPSSTCADALKVSPASGGADPKPVQTTEHIYACFGYSPGNRIPGFINMLKAIGATTQDNLLWTYRNTNINKTFFVHIVTTLDEMKQALQTEGAHILFEGHANYGLGPVFSTAAERNAKSIDDIYYIDDDRILNISSRWVSLDVQAVIRDHSFPNWWPEFKDGTSGIMPYTFGDPDGLPPYNYYLTYRVPGDPTYYKVSSGLRRFPSSGKPAWYSSTGAPPDPVINPEYFITNYKTKTKAPYPKYHYSDHTIIFRKELEIPVEYLKYSRMFYSTCYSGTYFIDTFHRGIMFYTVNDVDGGTLPVYLKAYMKGKSDYEIWQILQKIEPDFDYYDFNKLPSEQ